jgi:hypothetical protein
VSKHVGIELRGLLKKAGAITACRDRRSSETQRKDGYDCQPGTFQYTYVIHYLPVLFPVTNMFLKQRCNHFLAGAAFSEQRLTAMSKSWIVRL